VRVNVHVEAVIAIPLAGVGTVVMVYGTVLLARDTLSLTAMIIQRFTSSAVTTEEIVDGIVDSKVMGHVKGVCDQIEATVYG